MINLNLKTNQKEIVDYSYPDAPIYVKKAYLSYYPDFRAPSHWHDDIEFLLPIKGELDYYVNGNKISVKEGDCIVVNSNNIHFGFSDEKNECYFACVLLSPILLCNPSSAENGIPLIENKDVPYVYLNKDVSWQNSVIDKVKKIFEVASSPFSQLKIQGLFCEIWANLCENAVPSISANEKDLLTLKAMLVFIENNFQNSVRLKEIAKAGNVSPSKCNEIFNEFLNQPPLNYLMRFRIQKSLAYLKNSNLSLMGIAQKTGFSGTSYFIEQFKKIMGTTPKKYRES